MLIDEDRLKELIAGEDAPVPLCLRWHRKGVWEIAEDNGASGKVFFQSKKLKDLLDSDPLPRITVTYGTLNNVFHEKIK